MTRLVWLVAVLASVARADIPPPDSSGCRDKAAGAVCKRDDGTDATCVTATCSRHDYSNGPPPKSVKYDCLKCLPAAEAPIAAPTPAPAVAEAPAPAPPRKSSCATVPAETALGLLSLVFLRRRRAQLQPSATESAAAALSTTVEPRHR